LQKGARDDDPLTGEGNVSFAEFGDNFKAFLFQAVGIDTV
jgi:hypothetical protein